MKGRGPSACCALSGRDAPSRGSGQRERGTRSSCRSWFPRYRKEVPSPESLALAQGPPSKHAGPSPTGPAARARAREVPRLPAGEGPKGPCWATGRQAQNFTSSSPCRTGVPRGSSPWTRSPARRRRQAASSGDRPIPQAGPTPRGTSPAGFASDCSSTSFRARALRAARSTRASAIRPRAATSARKEDLAHLFAHPRRRPSNPRSPRPSSTDPRAFQAPCLRPFCST